MDLLDNAERVNAYEFLAHLKAHAHKHCSEDEYALLFEHASPIVQGLLVSFYKKPGSRSDTEGIARNLRQDPWSLIVFLEWVLARKRDGLYS